MKKLQLSDYIIIALVIILICVGAFLTIKHKKVSGLPETVEKKIYFQVMMRGVSLTDNTLPFQDGEKAFITIRNVPYTKLIIRGVSYDRRKQVVSANNKDGFIVVDDYSVPYLYDFIITLEDNAKWTDDGYVVGGNKLKIGIPITLEGERYKLNGTISNIKSVEEVMMMEQAAQQAQQTNNQQ